MILFWLICALFIVIAFAFIMPTAMQRNESSQKAIADERKLANIAIYRDQLSELEADLKNGIVSQDQYTQDRDEIERRLLEDTASTAPATRKAAALQATNKNTAYAIGVLLPLAAVIFYFQIGNPKAVTDPTGGVSATRSAPTGERTQEQIEANVTALAERLKQNPSDAQGWAMLARSYNSMSRFGEAAGAYAKATELQPNNADLMAEYAFVSAMANQQRLDGQPTELINQALKIDPENAKALQLAGSAAFQAKDYKKAIAYWERVLKKVESDSEVAQLMTERINEAKKLAANK
ncbi:MAG TPA: c-type cytochrome biogenesis protein CcmI [Pyrinomonadaceae bacterium]|nr:c-type cytochrome biogenesis protein CcmI [Pyrinomonadaceae bacterium]